MPLTCNVFVTNTGNVRLTSIIVNGGDCSKQLTPGNSVICSFSRPSTQDDFEGGSMSWTATATATPLGTDSTVISNSTMGTVDLDIVPALEVQSQRIVGSGNRELCSDLVAQAGTVVELLLTANNTGNVHLDSVTVQAPGLDTMLNCSSSLEYVPAGSAVECTGQFTFSQDALEAGSRNFTATAAAANLESVEANPVLVTVTAAPQLQLDVDAMNCSKPAGMRKLLLSCNLQWLRHAKATL